MEQNDQGYYKRMIDEDFKKNEVYERDIKDQAGEVLKQTGVQEPNKALYDDSSYVSPFEQSLETNEPYMRAKELNDLQRMPVDNIPQEIGTVDPLRNPAATYQPGPIEQAIGNVLKPPRAEIPLQSIPEARGERFTPVPLAPTRKEVSQRASVQVPGVGSTAPTDITEKELATGARDFNTIIADNLRGAPVYQELGKKAIEAEAGAEQEAQTLKAETAQAQAADIESQLARQRAQNATVRAEAEEMSKKIAEKVDPGRVWNNKATWAKISLVLGAALQNAAGSDAGLRTIDNTITRDLQAQMDDRNKGIIKHGNLLDLVAAGSKNESEILNKGREFSMKMVDAYMAAMKAGAKKDAAEYLALAKTAKDYTMPLFEKQIASQKGMMDVSGQQQKRKNDDFNLQLKKAEIQQKFVEAKMKESNLTEGDAKRFESIGNMSQAADTMAKLENKKDFNPTTVGYAISQIAAGKGIPGSLSKTESQYLAEYSRYYSYLKRELTGAAAALHEEEVIKRLVGAGQTMSKQALKDYQKLRSDQINIGVNALSNEGKVRLMNIPEARQFMRNKGAEQDVRLRGK